MAADTIFAVSSGRPPAAIAVIRVSGPDARKAGERIAGKLPAPRQTALRNLRDDKGALLDRALVMWFPQPLTATGEDVVELHCHGGCAVIASVEAMLAACDGLRRAEAGEFTRRALTNGRIDLLEAEGLADLLAAETEEQRRAALIGAGGVLSDSVREWMSQLALAAAEVEAQVDYADDGDVADQTSLAHPLSIVYNVVESMSAVLSQPSVDRIRDGIKIVVAGPPNTGKSSLINALAERDVAIASPIPGTTRDRLEAPVSRSGRAFVLVDTAGLTDTNDLVEAIGVTRAHHAIREADLLLWTGDRREETPADTSPNVVHLWTRSDLPSRREVPQGALPFSIYHCQSVANIWVSIDQVVGRLHHSPPLFSERQREEIAKATDDLTFVSEERLDPLIVSERLRRARGSLARLTGENVDETMLDALFGRFCVGK